jgi:HD-like signal output (HDOD) protein
MTESTTSTGLVQQFIERTERLYSLPAVAMEVLRLTAEPRVDARGLKECIERDPALTTRILRVVNSSLFAASREVNDLSQALALLGMRPLKMLVLGFSLPKELFSGIEAEVTGRYWRRTLIKAAAARELAQRQWRISGDEAFTAGLVQDIGVLALVQQMGPSYVEFLRCVQERGGNLLRQELETIGFDHCVLSARLLSHWGLSAGLCAAISVPPDEAAVEGLEPAERTLPRILHLAELLAQLLEQPYGPALRDLLEIGSRYCELDFAALQPIVSLLQRQVVELAEVLALNLPAGQDYTDLLITAQQRLAEESACLAAEQLSLAQEQEVLAAATRLRAEMAAAAKGAKAPAVVPAATAPAIAGNRPARTSEGADGGDLTSQLGAAIHRCRQARCSLGLAFIAVDRYDQLLLELGPGEAGQLLNRLRSGWVDCTSQHTTAVPVGEATFGLIWEDCPRNEAVALVRQIVSEAKAALPPPAGARIELTLSAGLATLEIPPRNFPPQQLIGAAQRCLSGAQLSGGDTLKSIAF